MEEPEVMASESTRFNNKIECDKYLLFITYKTER